MSRFHTGWPALQLLGGALLIPVCSSAAPPSAAPKVYTIEIKGSQFVPAELQVLVGDTVIWRNLDIVPHTTHAPHAFDSKNLGVGQEWRLVAKKSGTFHYACAYHPTMLGELVVR